MHLKLKSLSSKNRVKIDSEGLSVAISLVRNVDPCKLLEVGFEFVCDMDGKKLFRKRK